MPHLKELLLEDNQIETIENLRYMSTPSIQNLNISKVKRDIGRNLIVSIEPVKKCWFTSLNCLNLSCNFFLELTALKAAYFE